MTEHIKRRVYDNFLHYYFVMFTVSHKSFPQPPAGSWHFQACLHGLLDQIQTFYAHRSIFRSLVRRLASRGIKFSGFQFMCLLPNLKHGILKTNEPILQQIATSSPQGKGVKRQLWVSGGQMSRSHRSVLSFTGQPLLCTTDLTGFAK